MSDNKDDDNKFFKTAPLDARFQNSNVTKYCYVMFLDYIKCSRLLGEEHKGCKHFKDTYTSLCPYSWVERWNKQIEDGTFPHPLPKKKE